MTIVPGLPGRILATIRSAIERRLLGLSVEEIRYTIDDVRAELRATRAELLDEIARLRAEVDRISERERSPFERETMRSPGLPQ